MDWSGNAWYAGDIYVGSTSGKNKDDGSKKLATEEYVNSAISSSGGSGSNVQADWNQNDATANNYIKNRPGGYIDNDTIVKIDEKYLDIKNTNIVNGSVIGSLRTVGSSEESSEYKMGQYAFAEGYNTKASRDYSHAEGYNTEASGYSSHAEGFGTIANGMFQHVQGYYNKIDTLDVDGFGQYLDIVGYGRGDDNGRSNVYTLSYNGCGSFAGTVQTQGADYAEYFEWEDGNSENEDRVGLLVSLYGEKIKLAEPGDEILGIISGTAAVLGDNYEWEWNGKYLKDDFGRTVYEKVEEFLEVPVVNIETGKAVTETRSLGFMNRPKLNPNYDPEKEYINRRDRQEWDIVGMIGKLYLRDDGTSTVNGYVTVGTNGIATASSEKTNIRVLSRVNDHVVKVLLK